MSRHPKRHAVQQLHMLWAQQTLDVFTASGSYGTPPDIVLSAGCRRRGGDGRYDYKRNRVTMSTHVAMTRDEVEGLVGHELAHWARRKEQNRDYYSRRRNEILILFCATLIAFYARPWLGGIELAACGFLTTCIVPERWSRRAELDTDLTAASVVGPAPMLAMLVHADWFNRNIPWRHPRAKDRINAVRSVAAEGEPVEQSSKAVLLPTNRCTGSAPSSRTFSSPEGRCRYR